jgi:hypothetical protein
MTNSGGENSNVKPLMALLLVAVLGVVGYFIYKIGFSDYTVRPPKIFAEAFDEKPEVVTGLTGGGVVSGNYDYWIHFKLPGRMAEIKNKSEFQQNDQDKEMARRYFAGVETPPSTSLSVDQFNNLKFYSRVKNETQSVTSEWLLYNWRTDDQFYRKWGY